MIGTKLAIGFLSVAMLLVSSDAMADFGWVTGTLEFASQQGNYCKTSTPQNMDCTAARYPAADAVGTQPVKDAQIVLRANGQNIGVGFTDRNGAYVVFWEMASTPSSITVRWNLRHKDGIFRVADNNNVLWWGDFETVTPVHNDIVLADPGFWSFTQVNNLYDAAQRTWWEALRFSNLMLSDFTDVTIRWPDTSVGSNLCAVANNVVLCNGDVAQRPQSKISHEMSHVAINIAEPFSYCGALNWPGSCSGNPLVNCTGFWQQDTAEHYCVGFEEGMATFLGDVAYYWPQATAPTTCNSSSLCTSTAHNTETSAGSGCTSFQRHTVMNAIKYLRDVYDTVNDSGFNDNVSTSYSQMIVDIGDFPGISEGGEFGNGGVHEPWNTAITQITDQDGRSTRDYRKYVSADTSVLYSQNCSPGGD